MKATKQMVEAFEKADATYREEEVRRLGLRKLDLPQLHKGALAAGTQAVLDIAIPEVLVAFAVWLDKYEGRSALDDYDYPDLVKMFEEYVNQA